MSENLLYVLLWSAIFLVPVLNAELTSQERVYLVEVFKAWCKTLPYFVVFLLHNNIVIPRYLWTRRYTHYVAIISIMCVTIYTLVDYFQYDAVQMLHSIGLVTDTTTFLDLPIFGNFIISMFMCAANMGVSMIYRSIESDEKMEALVRHNLQVEMDYLRYQINPHFFMNTLNNIHALIDIDADSAKSAVIELSKMMRYVLYESGSESISLGRDLQFVGNYIELMKIRYDGSVDVTYNYSDQLPRELSIPPLLFIVFVENAFKHGLKAGEGNFINIDISYEEERLHCVVVNSLGLVREDLPTGIGLINVRKRLELMYGDKFTLETQRRASEYYLHLTIPVKV